MRQTALHLAVCGATGAVGREMIEILEERKFPISEIHLYASARSLGSTLTFQESAVPVKVLDEADFSDIDIVLGATDASLSRVYTPRAVACGAVVIDNSSAFRMDVEVPLVVPEVNGHCIAMHRGILANPNCATAQLVMALAPLHQAAQLRRVVTTTFQSVSGTGLDAMEELMAQTRALLAFKEVTSRVYDRQIAFNCIVNWPTDPETGDTEEETKIVNETLKILGDTSIRVAATTVRVPVFRSHAASVNIETARKLPVREARAALAAFPGVIVMDDPERQVYPTPLDAAGKDDVYVGRIREDRSIENGLQFWVVADNLRKGAALNAVQIAEALIHRSVQ